MAKTPKTPKVYTFKPMKGLTFWAVLLAGLQVAGMTLWGLGMAIWMAVPALNSVAAIVFTVGYFLGVLMLVISGIVSLIWIYGATRNAHVLRPGGVRSSPGWAVGWFFVPFAFLYKPVQNMREVWIASRGMVNGRYLAAPRLLAFWWLTEIAGNVLFRIGDVTTGGEGALPSTPGNWTMVAATLVSAASAVLFAVIMRDIGRNQLNTRITAADVF